MVNIRVRIMVRVRDKEIGLGFRVNIYGYD